MATLISRANGNFTDAATWGVADAASLLDSQTGGTLTTTTYQNSLTFVPAAVQVDAVALKVSARAGIVGTLDVSLYNSTGAAEAGLVTVNLADMPTTGWVVFRLPAPVTPNGTDAYLVRVRHAAGASAMTLYRDAAGNWSRMLRTTTTGAPVAADRLVIAGELTGVGTGTDLTVTMNNTATTIFGDNSTTIPSVTVNKRGILQLATAAATNYYLKLNSSLMVYDGGTLNLGTSGTPLPVSSTAVVELNSTVAGDFGLEVYGTMNIWGDSKRSWCLLTANVAAAGTVLTVQDTTGWQVGDEVCIGSTSRTAAECEKRTILTVDSATQITLTAGVTFAHSGISPTQAEVGNLTRNVKIRGISLTLTGYIRCYAASLVTARYVEILWMGINTSGKFGTAIDTVTGVADWQNSSLHEAIGISGGRGFTVITGASGVILSSNVFYSLRGVAITTGPTTGTLVVQNNLCMLNTTAVDLVTLGDVGGVFTGNYIVGGTAVGLTITEAAPIGTMTGNVIHSCATNGLAFSVAGSYGNTSLSCTIWRCASTGINLAVALVDLTLTGCVMFGNALNVLPAGVNGTAARVTFVSCTFSGDTTFASTHGLTGGSVGAIRAAFIDCTFGVVSGIRTAHTVGDIGGAQHYQLTLWNTLLASAVEVVTPASMIAETSYIKSANHDQVPGQLRNWYKYGRVESDTTIFSTLSPSLRLIPTSATAKVSYTICLTAIASGTAPQVSVKVRQSVIGDGTAYDGALPRLLVRRNEQLGIMADTVLATATAASLGAWETITGTLPIATNNGKFECYVDADGTTGWVNVDDVTLPAALLDTTGFLYGLDGEQGALTAGPVSVTLAPADAATLAALAASVAAIRVVTDALPNDGALAALANLDAAISSRLASTAYTPPLDAAGHRAAIGLAAANMDTQLAALAGVATLLARLTAARAGYLDNVNNATLAGAVFPTDPADQSLVIAATNALAAAIGALQVGDAVNTALAGVGLTLTVTGRIDEAISSRLPTTGYTAPLDAAGHRAAIGLAAANMDTQLAAIAQLADALTSGMQQGAPLAGFSFTMLSSTDHVTPLPSLVVSASRSLAGAAFTPCANAPVELAGGAYTLDLAGSDLDARVVLLRLEAEDADPRFVTFVLEPTP